MFGDGEGLETEVKFAVAAAYDKFNEKWGLPTEKLRWVDIWSPCLSRFSVAEINAIAAYIVTEYRRPPVPVEYIELCTRLRDGKALSDPIVSKIERMAYLILANDDFQGASSSEISDACLIAASISSLNSYAELGMKDKQEWIKQELSGRLNMFFEEAKLWQMDAKEGKGYWNGTISE
ncbi:hypothetical protein [Janthinobacterium rivuli]|uniref:hypothetical protein n=1 Tax=Janthinobacterium rivuli TaxID=2751478 RepID=UPI00383AD5A0